MKKSRKSDSSGFVLLEVLIGIVIAGILLTQLITVFGNKREFLRSTIEYGRLNYIEHVEHIGGRSN